MLISLIYLRCLWGSTRFSEQFIQYESDLCKLKKLEMLLNTVERNNVFSIFVYFLKFGQQIPLIM